MNKILLFVFICISAITGFSQTTESTYLQEVIDNKVNYFKTLRPDVTIPEYNLVIIPSENWESVSTQTKWSFEAGYVDGTTVYVTEPISTEQSEIFPDIESIARYTITKEMVIKIGQHYNRDIPDWLLYGYSAFEARLPRPYESIQGIFSANGEFPEATTLLNFQPESNEEQRNLAFTLAEYWVLIHGDRNIPFQCDSNTGELLPFNSSPINDVWHLFLEKHYMESDTQIKLLDSNEDFAIYGAPIDAPYASDYLTELSSLLTTYENNFGVQVTNKLNILVNPDNCTQLNVEGSECNSNYGGGGHGNGMSGCTIVSPSNYGPYDYFMRILLHEFTHVYQFWIKSNYMPAWLSEGFANRLPSMEYIQDPFISYKTDMNNKWTTLMQSLEEYPTMEQLMDYDYVRNNVDYYTLGALMVDYIIQKGGYLALKDVIETDGLDFSSMNYDTKEDFLADFYFYFDIRIMNKKIVELESPQSDILYESENMSINWTPLSTDEELSLEIFYDNSVTWETLLTQSSSTSYDLNIQDDFSGEIYLRFSAPDNLNVSSAFGPFFVSNSSSSSISISGISGGESYVAGDIVQIKWISSMISNIDISYSRDNGNAWGEIASDYDASEATYNWTVPQTAGNSVLLKVADSNNSDIFDISDEFKIVESNIIGGPYANDENTLLLLHAEGNLKNQSTFSEDAEIAQGTVEYAETGIDGLGKAFYLDNTDGTSYLTVPHSESLSLDNDWTIELWFKPTSFNDDYQYMIFKPGDDHVYESNFTIQLLDDNLSNNNELYVFYHTIYDFRVDISSGITPALNEWYHVAFMRNKENNSIDMIVRNSEREIIFEKTEYRGGTALTSLKDLRIGFNFTGYIDEIRISNIVRNFIPTGIDKIDVSDEYTILPNPASEYIRFDIPEKSDIQVYSSTGVCVFNKNDVSPNEEVNVSDLAPGMYFILIKNEERTISKKVIIQ